MNESIFQHPDSYVGNKDDHYVSEGMIENVVYASRHDWGGWETSETRCGGCLIFLAPIMNFFSEMMLQTKMLPEETHYEGASEVA